MFWDIVIIAVVVIIVIRLGIVFKDKISFFATGNDKGFKLSEVNALWRLAKENGIIYQFVPKEKFSKYIVIIACVVFFGNIINGGKRMLSFKAFPYEGKELRTVTVNGEPWFVATDACSILGLHNVTNAMKALREDEKIPLRKVEGYIEEEERKEHFTLNSIKGKGWAVVGQKIRHNATLINESGLYRLIMRSDRAEAEAFQDWVLREVLPMIRKTGSYKLSEAPLQEHEKPAVTKKTGRLGWSVKKEVHYDGVSVLTV